MEMDLQKRVGGYSAPSPSHDSADLFHAASDSGESSPHVLTHHVEAEAQRE